MNHGAYSVIGNSISPVDQRALEVSEGNKELVDTEGQKSEEVVPVPEDGEEVRQPRIGWRPMAPTKAETEEHYSLHLNYRAWCEHCRKGRGRQDPHIVEAHDRERLRITFNADYAFLTPEEKEEDMQPSLVMYDDDKESLWAIGVESKGLVNPW